MSLSRVVRGGFWLYIGSLLTIFLTYVYWLIASNFVVPNVVGSAGAVMSMQSLLVSVFSFGLPSGLQRFVGLCKGKNDYQQLSEYFFSSLFFTLSISTLLALSVLVSSLIGFSIFNLNSAELSFIVILTLLGSWQPIFISLFNSILRTEVTARAQAISAFSRLLIGIPLLYFGLSFLGVMLGLIVASVTMGVLLSFYAVMVLKDFGAEFRVNLSHLKDPLKAGLASWVPNVLTILGQSFGVLSVYGLVGGAETGLYYMAFAIASIVYSTSTSILSLMFPVLSSMEDGRKRAMSRIMGISLTIAAPVALALALYPNIPLSLLGPKYLQASTALTILALGAVISPVIVGYSNYVYAVGKYVQVVLIGLAANLSMLTLYVLLVPSLEATGAATAYVLGILISLAAVVLSARKSGYRLNWSQYAKIIVIPGVLTAFLYTLNVHWVVGVPAILLISAFAYARLRIVSKNDLLEFSQAFMSEERILKLSVAAKPIIRIMFGE